MTVSHMKIFLENMIDFFVAYCSIFGAYFFCFNSNISITGEANADEVYISEKEKLKSDFFYKIISFVIVEAFL